MESVWDYPRPPAVEPTARRIRIVFDGSTIVDTTDAVRVLETSHPPVYYVPISDIAPGAIEPSDRQTFCEFKGMARYYTVVGPTRTAPNGAWAYPTPSPGYESLVDHVAFYPSKMDACYVDDERIEPQAGDFYGGWITSDIAGPFKGGPGTRGW